MTEELKPCPFCGGKNIDPTFWARNDGKSGPGCDDCSATADSAEAWNKRQVVASDQREPAGDDECIIRLLRQIATDFAIDHKTDCKQHICWLAAERLTALSDSHAEGTTSNEPAAWHCPACEAAVVVDDDYILPCDVNLPPATTIAKGCTLSTLIAALKVREKGWPEVSAEQVAAVNDLLKREFATGDWQTVEVECQSPAANDIKAIRDFAESFHVTVVDNFYQDVTLHLDRPHSLSIRLQNDSTKSWIFADLEKRRRDALAACPSQPVCSSKPEPRG